MYKGVKRETRETQGSRQGKQRQREMVSRTDRDPGAPDAKIRDAREKGQRFGWRVLLSVNICAKYGYTPEESEQGEMMVSLAVRRGFLGEVRFKVGIDGICIATDAVGAKWEPEGIWVGTQRPAHLRNSTCENAKGGQKIFISQNAVLAFKVSKWLWWHLPKEQSFTEQIR